MSDQGCEPILAPDADDELCGCLSCVNDRLTADIESIRKAQQVLRKVIDTIKAARNADSARFAMTLSHLRNENGLLKARLGATI